MGKMFCRQDNVSYLYVNTLYVLHYNTKILFDTKDHCYSSLQIIVLDEIGNHCFKQLVNTSEIRKKNTRRAYNDVALEK